MATTSSNSGQAQHMNRATSDAMVAFRIRSGLGATKEARQNYLKFRAHGNTTNECFVQEGSKPAENMKITQTVAPSKAGKPSNFFNLREQMATNKGLIPSKNERSLSFAVDSAKVERRNYFFNPKNLLLKEKNKFSSMKQAELDHEAKKAQMGMRRHANRHMSRNDGVSHSIDFVNHCEVRGPRSASDGGFF